MSLGTLVLGLALRLSLLPIDATAANDVGTPRLAQPVFASCSGGGDGATPDPARVVFAASLGGLVGGVLGGGVGSLLYLASGIGQTGVVPAFLALNVVGPLAGVLLGTGLAGGLSLWPSLVGAAAGVLTTVLIAAFPFTVGSVLMPWFVALALAPAVTTVVGYSVTWALVERPHATEAGSGASEGVSGRGVVLEW